MAPQTVSATILDSVVRVVAYEALLDWKMPFQQPNPTKNVGSGFFIDGDGHVLTCSHVVENNAREIYVQTSSGDQKYSVTVVGLCPQFDLAVLKVRGYKNASYCKLNGGFRTPGAEAYALGYPLGQDNVKITKGIVSGQQYNFLQTDAPINPGNSGGPLVYKNRVIGVNAAGIAAKDAEGIGYAVPIGRFLLIRDALMKKGGGGGRGRALVHYPEYFGFEMQPTSPDQIAALGSKCKAGGMYVNDVVPKSPVASTSIRKGDVLCELNGVGVDPFGKMRKRWMNDTMSLQSFLFEVGFDRPVRVRFWRDAKMRTETFAIKPFVPKIRTVYPSFEHVPYVCVGGVVLMDMNRNIINDMNAVDLQPYLHIDKAMEERVVITNVLAGGSIARLNILAAGNLVTRVNGTDVRTVRDVVRALRRCKRARYTKLETDKGKVLVMATKTIRDDDARLGALYNYTPVDLK